MEYKKDESAFGAKKTTKKVVDYGSNYYILQTSVSRFDNKFFGKMLTSTDPLFVLVDMKDRETRDLRKYKDKPVIVEIIAKDGEPKVLNYYVKDEAKSVAGDLFETILKEIFK